MRYQTLEGIAPGVGAVSGVGARFAGVPSCVPSTTGSVTFASNFDTAGQACCVQTCSKKSAFTSTTLVSSAMFNKVDHEIFCALWKWAQRRHPHKSKGWIRQKYFRRMNGRSWVFAADTQNRRGEPVTTRLTFAGDVKIQRHVKIRRETNPYAAEFREYFAQRRYFKAMQRKHMQHRQVALWLRQGGTCPQCGQPIDLERDFDEHHIHQRQHGGSDDWSNLVLLHPNCHRQEHHATVQA